MGGVIPTNALSKEAVTLPASMLPNSAAKDPNMISPFYSSHPFFPSIIDSVIPFSLDIQKPYLISQPFVQECISVLICMKGDIRGRCSSACIVVLSVLWYCAVLFA
ncbi:hypothetical protein QNH26_15705 [Peribacillus frigoritolerans]|uniref:hypothetical protein n=1 Tax=Peribacillus frigoritolerans TaxID=450367 RepID=UPI0024C1EA76|nr:hypothetical protein [Peribacillus frigoritolerans]WHX65149.1 hypothetical protein QNH26_15705 [Peribacillus frigoritolerans]